MDRPPSRSRPWTNVIRKPARFRPSRASLRAVGSKARHPLWWLPDPAVQQEDAYRRVWQNLRTLKEVRDGRHDTPAWRARGGSFAMCCVQVPRDALSDEIEQIRGSLEQFPFVRLHPASFFHIPVQEIAFLTDTPTHRDEMTRGRLDEFIVMAERALKDFPRFTVSLGPVNSFADAAFLDIHDDGWLSRIHRRLIELMAVSPSTRYPYVPHMTIAHYDRIAPLGTLPAVLAQWRDTSLGGFDVDHVDIALVPTDTTFPPLEIVHSFRLGSTRATGSIPVRPSPSFD